MCISLEESSTLSKLRGTELDRLPLLVTEANLEDLKFITMWYIERTVSLKDNISGKLMQCVHISVFPFRKDVAGALWAIFRLKCSQKLRL